MMKMQRSSSLPGPGQAPPPPPSRSPTITQASSRSPTPAPLNRPFLAQPLESIQPPEPGSPYAALLAAKATHEHAYTGSASKPSGLSEASKSTSSVSKASHIPLLQDVSEFTNFHLKDAASEAPSTTLEELAHLVRLSKYQERKRSQSRLRLQRLLVSTALSARLTRCGELSHRTLVENFRADDKKGFAALYNAVHDVRNSCDATRRFALLEPEIDSRRPKSDHPDGSESHSTFMHEIPAHSRETLLNFLSQIRTNPEYLAARICNLSSAELSALSLFHQGLEPIDSVLPFHTRSKGHPSSSNRNSSNVPSAVERLLSFQRHDPLSALIHTCFANSSGPESSEDLRRTDIWSTVCARLISEGKSGAENFICCVINIWASMRDWSGKSNMEWYLMKILGDGSFLLEKAEDQAGTRIHVEPRNAKDSIAAEEFYDAAIKGLFEIVDDPGAGGIPEGLLELGNAILRKLDPKRHGATKRLLVTKWLFSIFLLNAVIHPESYGMMSEYHITEYGRQKILKEVAMKAQRLVVDLTWRQQGATPPNIRVHIDSILDQFRTTPHSRANSKLLPARSITSLRETIEVQPYLVISPSDLVTIVNALFPERRPASSSLEKDMHLHGLRSTASSISGMSGGSLPASVPPPSRSGFDTASVISNSGSSIFSESTSREPLLDDNSIATNRFSSTSISSMSQATRFEDEGYILRLAIKEMSQALGAEATSGSCHPCAEQWAVLFMENDGQYLTMQMLHDDDDDADADEENSSSSESEEDVDGSRPELDKDYHQLRDSILKLVEDFEIPQELNENSESKTFSNRAFVLQSPGKKGQLHKRSSRRLQMQSKNPYRLHDKSPAHSMSDSSSSVHRQISLESTKSGESGDVAEQPPALLNMLEAAVNQCQAQSDFVSSHLYWRTLQQLHHISAPSLKENGFLSLLNIFSRGPRDSIRRSASAIEEYDAWLVWLKQSQERHDITIELMMKRLRFLRDKMWYVTDVRNSAAYEGARNVAVALKSMAAIKSNKDSTSSTRARNLSRSATNNFLLKTEAQIMDIMAAPVEYGGPNKLSDDQAERTSKWLAQSGIENFCKGEERIHRFCLEVQTCINKLVGDSLMEGPVLWSSELFFRDKRILDSGRQKGDLVLTELGSLSIIGDNGQDSSVGRQGLRSIESNPTSRAGRDLRSMSARNTSQQSFESGRWTTSRSSVTGDLMDSQDYFGSASPVLTIDSATTFWSPFQTRMQSPTTSVSSFRPGTASTTNDTVTLSNPDGTLATVKQDFLVQLKQTLTALLISDLGTLVFSRGSETDSWFSGDLGQDCLERKERQDRKIRKKHKKRVIEKKKSFRDLRTVHGAESKLSEQVDKSSSGSSARPVNELPAHENHSLPDSSSTSDTLSNSSNRRQLSKEVPAIDFPYKASFHKLLKMFSVHPDPYVKLNALFELEHLIVASLTTMPHRKSLRHNSLSLPLSSPVYAGGDTAFRDATINITTTQAKNLDEAIDNCNKRRSQIVNQGDFSPQSRRAADARSISASTIASTDMIVEVMQDLFRNASVRPKTLFRDLQYIAAFVPAYILDKTDRGKAFWDAGLAALGLKQDICRSLIEIADEIVVYYTQTRQTSTSTIHAQTLPSSMSLPDSDVKRYSMQDAARMWTITAKEGDAVAERELAIFYLTHPELVERTTLPLTKPRDAFKTQVMEMHASGGEGDRERNDPATMCVAYHWMELSATGGDELAKKYLRQREELNALP